MTKWGRATRRLLSAHPSLVAGAVLLILGLSVYPWPRGTAALEVSSITILDAPSDLNTVVVTSYRDPTGGHYELRVAVWVDDPVEEPLAGEARLMLGGPTRTAGCSSACETQELPSATFVSGDLTWADRKHEGLPPFKEGTFTVKLPGRAPFTASDGIRARALLPEVHAVGASPEAQVFFGLSGMDGYSLTSGPAPERPAIVGFGVTSWRTTLGETNRGQYVEGTDYRAEQLAGFRNYLAGIVGGLGIAAVFSGLERAWGWNRIDKPEGRQASSAKGLTRRTDRIPQTPR